MTDSKRWLRPHLFPTRLSVRLTGAIVLTGAVVYVVVAVIIGVLLSLYTRSLGAGDSHAHLTELRYFIDLQAREIDALAVGFAEWNEFYEQSTDPDEAFIAAEFDPWLADRASALTVVWVNVDGDIISSSGSEANVRELLDLAESHPAGTRGPVALPSGPAVVTVRPIVGDPAGTPAGFLAVAREVSHEGLPGSTLRSAVIAGEDTLPEPGNGWRAIDEPAGYSQALMKVEGGHMLTRAELLGIDRRPALVIQLTRPDPWLGEGQAALIYLVPLGFGIVTLGVAFLLGMALSRGIEKPLHRFVEYLQEQGYLALHGLRTDETLLFERGLTEDFMQLGNVIMDLMTQLRINQAELIEAGDQALAAEMAFRTVVEESPEVKILVRDEVVEIANPAAAHFFGLQLGDLVRAEPQGLFSGIKLFDESDNRLELLSVARDARQSPVVARCVTPDQPDRWIEVSVAFIDSEGKDYVISARNITEEKRLEALRAEVLSLVSHDLRSPLTVVRGYLDILDRPLDDDRRKGAVESARRAAVRMEDLLDDLLHATRVDRVFAPRVMRPIDLSSLVEGVAASLQMGASQTVTSTMEEGITVLGDPVRLEQAIANLVGNAIKYSPLEGEVRVSVARRDGRAIVSVEDDGPGIPEERRESVFERGARGEGVEGTPGLGLGLYIVRVVAEAHGGLAFIDSSSTHMRFVLDLPVMQPDVV